jgi:hypothetical protein
MPISNSSQTPWLFEPFRHPAIAQSLDVGRWAPAAGARYRCLGLSPPVLAARQRFV